MSKKFYYVSLAYYGHKVFKCRGSGAEKPDHLAFYKPRFEQFGEEATNELTQKRILDRKEGPYTVLILNDYKGDKVLADGTPVTIGEAMQMRCRLRRGEL